MPNKEMRAAVEEFILQRINDWGSDESQGLQTAIEQWKLSTENLSGLYPTSRKFSIENVRTPMRWWTEKPCSVTTVPVLPTRYCF